MVLRSSCWRHGSMSGLTQSLTSYLVAGTLFGAMKPKILLKDLLGR